MEAGRCTMSWAGTGGLFEGLSEEAEQKPAQDKKAGSQGARQLGGRTQVLFFQAAVTQEEQRCCPGCS